MDSSDFPAASRSPLRKELQGPRPPALKVSKDSCKIKKPPGAPMSQQTQPRLPVIIYTVSPKVIHTNPDDFMTLVQRLTGASSVHSSPTSNCNPLNDGYSRAVSPAARYATVEKAKSTKEKQQLSGGMQTTVEDIEMDRQNMFPVGILSPGPAFLPPIQPNCFSVLSEPNTVSFFHDFSPVLHGNRNFMEGSFMPSPSAFVSPRLSSPITPSVDLFNNFFEP